MDELIESQPKRSDYCIRLVIALVYFGLLFYLVKTVVGLVLLAQFILGIFAGQINRRLVDFTGDLNRFSYHVLQYLTWNSNDRPFPFSDWPGPDDQNPVRSDS